MGEASGNELFQHSGEGVLNPELLFQVQCRETKAVVPPLHSIIKDSHSGVRGYIAEGKRWEGSKNQKKDDPSAGQNHLKPG